MPTAIEETAQQVAARRGSPQDTLKRIREKYHLAESVTDEHIFFLACHFYYHAEAAQACFKKDYARYLEKNEMPEYVYRCGDPDVSYPKMFGMT